MTQQSEFSFAGERVPLLPRDRHPVGSFGFVHLARCRRRDVQAGRDRRAELREMGTIVGWLVWAKVACDRGHMSSFNELMPAGYPRSGTNPFRK